jgi:tetratricopeptide (TPR) repeat protein
MRLRTIFLSAALATTALLCAAEGPASNSSSSSTSKTEASLSAADLELRGDVFRSQNDIDEAQRYYGLALKKNPKNAKVWNKLGVMALRSREYPAAQTNFMQAIKYDKHFAEAVNNLGVLYYFKKDFVHAEAQYRKAIQLADTASFHSNLGALYFETNDPKLAIEQYRIAIQMDPLVLERSSPSGVSAHAGTAVERGRYAFLMTRLYAKLGDVDHALTHLRTALQNGYKPPQDFMTDEDFVAMRQDPRFPEVMSTPEAAAEPVTQ